MKPFFWLISVLVIIFAFLSIFTSNLVRAIFWLFLTLFGVGLLYLLAGSDFLFISQLIIYVGGVAVLFVFGILMTPDITKSETRFSLLTAVLVVPVFAVGVWFVFSKVQHFIPKYFRDVRIDIGNIGRYLITHYAVPFELVTIAIVVSVVGVAYIIRREAKK